MVMPVFIIMISDLEALLLIKKIKPNSLKSWHVLKDHRLGIEKTAHGEKAVRAALSTHLGVFSVCNPAHILVKQCEGVPIAKLYTRLQLQALCNLTGVATTLAAADKSLE